MNEPRKKVLLGIDLEEFDLPTEFGHSIDPASQIGVSAHGLRIIEKILAMKDIPATFFTTGWWAERCPAKVNRLAGSHEIASHTLHHSRFDKGDLLTSRNILRHISGQPVTGIRMPRMGQVDDMDLKEAGYEYNSSSHPTYIPGRYNGLRAERLISIRGDLVQLPVSVSPVARIPVFWLSFRHLPFRYYWHLCQRILATDGYLVLYFHPWEFVDLSDYGLPWYLRHGTGEQLVSRFWRLLEALQEEADFSTHAAFVEGYKEKVP